MVMELKAHDLDVLNAYNARRAALGKNPFPDQYLMANVAETGNDYTVAVRYDGLAVQSAAITAVLAANVMNANLESKLALLATAIDDVIVAYDAI